MVWKIGPECAAQHAKYVSARTMKGAERSAPPTDPCVPAGRGDFAESARAAGAWRTNREAGMSGAQTRIAMMSCAERQSVHDTSHAEKGDSVSGATPTPTETSDTARLRWRSNHDITAVIMGAKKLPAATPTTMPYVSRNPVSLVARLASARPRPSSTDPASTTGRGPKRSLKAPHPKPAMPMAMKLSVMAP